LVTIYSRDAGIIPEKTVEKKVIIVSKKNHTDDKSYKELVAEAAVERYEKKTKNRVSSKLTKDQIDEYKRKWGMEDINTIDDVIRSLNEKKKKCL
jgi:hypothetical protein